MTYDTTYGTDIGLPGLVPVLEGEAVYPLPDAFVPMFSGSGVTNITIPNPEMDYTAAYSGMADLSSVYGMPSVPSFPSQATMATGGTTSPWSIKNSPLPWFLAFFVVGMVGYHLLTVHASVSA